MKKLLTVIIPTYNQIEIFEKIINTYSINPKIKIIVSDDSDNLICKEKIKGLCKLKKIDYYDGPQVSAVDNWNFLLEKIDTPFFVLNHHDEYPNNLNFINKINSKVGIILLPCSSYVSNKLYRKFYSWQQKLHILLFRFYPNVLINLFLAPTAAVIVNTKFKSVKFNKKLKWHVDTEWYYRLIKISKEYKLDFIFSENSRIISFQSTNSITFRIKKELKNIINYEKKLLKKEGMVPFYLIQKIQKLISLLITLNSRF